jgi:hypothetical protein
MKGARLCCPNVPKLGDGRKIFLKVPNIKFHENRSFGSRVDICGRTDEAKGCFSLIIRVFFSQTAFDQRMVQMTTLRTQQYYDRHKVQ